HIGEYFVGCESGHGKQEQEQDQQTRRSHFTPPRIWGDPNPTGRPAPPDRFRSEEHARLAMWDQ
ncbi:MAG TPA: hypothetical protein VE222_06825, partial [Nitrospiraceae bacterium]|nr:hypothetical protein [Nitrospiraceae bacterium]